MKTATAPRKRPARRARPAKEWRLRLYVAGVSPKGVTALENLERLCKTHLDGLYQIEVIDLLKHPNLAKGDQIFAVPTLVRRLPKPIKKIIGDLSNTERTMVGLNLLPARESRSS